MDLTRLKQFADDKFQDQSRVLGLWQTLAENFYPERSDFTLSHGMGDELADGLASSQPILIRRELANSFSSMLRDGEWFNITTQDDPDHISKKWLEFGSTRLLRLMEHRSSNFRRATKEGDHDYATFGQNVMSIEPNKMRNGLLFKTWHLRDCAWWDNDVGQVGGLVRRWAPKYHELRSYFGMDKLHRNMTHDFDKNLFKDAEIIHFDMPTDMFELDNKEVEQFEYVSLWFDVKNKHVIDMVGKRHRTYVVPRFQTISGSPYAYSPATVVGLPDARTLQAMTHTLLEAGERHARPPIIATEGVIRGDANLYADGITYVSEDYDERLGASMRPLIQDAKGFPLGMEMAAGIVDVLQSAFYVNKIDLPDKGGEMTAYEFSERMKLYRRQNLPLFSPLEHEYNGQICELSFSICMEFNMIGSPQDIPEPLRGQEVIFKFESPLTESEEEKKVQLFSQVSEMLGRAAEYDQGVAFNVDFDVALRDSIGGIGAPSTWLREVEEVGKKKEQMEAAQAQIMQQQMSDEVAA
jgi:hypothetical protein